MKQPIVRHGGGDEVPVLVVEREVLVRLEQVVLRLHDELAVLEGDGRELGVVVAGRVEQLPVLPNRLELHCQLHVARARVVEHLDVAVLPPVERHHPRSLLSQQKVISFNHSFLLLKIAEKYRTI